MFQLNLPKDFEVDFARTHAELARLFRLTDVWLANALLKLARQAQVAMPQCRPESTTYESRLVFGVVPELARRLGIVKLGLPEIDWEVRELSNYDLRLKIGITLANASPSLAPGWDLLTREAVNGNPVVFAIDRLCPGRPGDRDDRLTRRALEVARYRGIEYNGVWSPVFLQEPGILPLLGR